DDLTGRGGEDDPGFRLDPRDFAAARVQGASSGTLIEARTVPLAEAGEVLNRSFVGQDAAGRPVHVASPVVIPQSGLAKRIFPLAILTILGLVGLAASGLPIDTTVLFGPHYWAVLVLAALFLWWRRSVVMIPDGCRALIAKFGKLVQIAEPGRVTLFNPWKRV